MGSKCCSRCGEVKPLSEFHRLQRRGGAPGHVSRCKACRSAQRKAWRDTSASYRQAQARHKRRWLLAQYGLTVEAYDELLAAQGGGCAMCGQQCRTGRHLAIDHDHETGRVRGLLCFECNRDLGAFERLRERAEKYLATPPLIAVYVQARVMEGKMR